MSDLMLYGVLRMPYELAMEGDISRLQFYQRAQEAANRLERADAEIADLRAALAAKAVPDGWQPIETAPKDGTDILVMYVHIETQVVHNGFWIGIDDAQDESDIGWWSYDHSEVSRIKLDDWMTPTHWMPLPAAPSPEQEG